MSPLQTQKEQCEAHVLLDMATSQNYLLASTKTNSFLVKPIFFNGFNKVGTLPHCVVMVCGGQKVEISFIMEMWGQH